MILCKDATNQRNMCRCWIRSFYGSEQQQNDNLLVLSFVIRLKDSSPSSIGAGINHLDMSERAYICCRTPFNSTSFDFFTDFAVHENSKITQVGKTCFLQLKTSLLGVQQLENEINDQSVADPRSEQVDRALLKCLDSAEMTPSSHQCCWFDRGVLQSF